MSENLEKLILAFTGSTVEQGQAFLQVLADADSSSLKSLEIIGESNWFEGEEGKESVNALIAFLERQVNLKNILMTACGLT